MTLRLLVDMNLSSLVSRGVAQSRFEAARW